MKEYIQQGVLPWLISITALLGSIVALLNALWPFLDKSWKWWRARRSSKSASTPPDTDVTGRVQIRLIRPKSLIVGLMLLFLSVGIFDYITRLPQISESESRTNAAWYYFKKGEPDPVLDRPATPDPLRRAIKIADAVIADLKGAADGRERDLRANSMPIPPTGDVSPEQRRSILAYGPLNDVATCLWIKGRAFHLLKQTNDAKYAYLELTNYPHARTWDPRGWFWSPLEDALGRLDTLTNAAPQR